MNTGDKALRLQAEHEKAQAIRAEAVNRAVDAIEAFTQAMLREYESRVGTYQGRLDVDETREQMRESLAGLVK